MTSLFILLFDLVLLAVYSMLGFIAFMLVQGIVYWTTGFSIMRFAYYHLFVKELSK